eukprot:1159306-Pelagomonas_calceolata.AAC.18
MEHANMGCGYVHNAAAGYRDEGCGSDAAFLQANRQTIKNVPDECGVLRHTRKKARGPMLNHNALF